MNCKKKLLVFAQSNVGGAERMSVTITKSLDRKEYDVVYYLIGMSTDSEFELAEHIPSYYTVNRIQRSSPLKLMYKILQAIIKEKPDCVFSSTLYINNKILPFSCLFRNTRFVVRCENYLYTFKSKQRKVIEHVYKLADAIVAQTEEMKQELVEQAKINEKKIYVLHNPIDKETIDSKVSEGKSPYMDNRTLKFVASGRFTKQKGYDLLVKAFDLVKQKLPQSELFIIGNNDGKFKDYYELIKGAIIENNLEDSIHCIGYQNNPYQYVKNADCFVLSSRWEGLPNVLIEALYLGTPVAAFKCIPIVERIVNEGVDGFLAEKEDVYSLSEAMLKTIKLGRIKSSYVGARIEDFANLFSKVIN